MHICIIDMQMYHSNVCDFQRIFEIIDKNITVSVMKFNKYNLIEEIKQIKPNAIIMGGSKYSVIENQMVKLSHSIMTLGIPVLGICYGFEWQMKNFGGSLGSFDGYKVYHKIFEINQPFVVRKKLYLYKHNDYVSSVPSNWKIAMANDKFVSVAYEPNSKHMGIQFHPEKHKASGIAFFSAWLKWIS